MTKRLTRNLVIYTLSNLLMIAFGAILVMTGRGVAVPPQTSGGETLYRQDGTDQLLTGIGVSILAAGVTGIVLIGWILVTESTRNRIVVLDSFGITDYFDANTTPIAGEYRSRLSGSNHPIDVLGVGLSHLRKDFSDDILRWGRTRKVRILLLDPEFPTSTESLADIRDREEADPKGSISGEVREWRQLYGKILGQGGDRLTIRLARAIPTLTMVRIGDEIFWSPYLIDRGSGSTPTMLVRRGGILFSVLNEHFEKTWNSDTFSKEMKIADQSQG